MYPFRTRTRWLVASRYAHLVHALDRRRNGRQDSTLEARLDAVRLWNRVHGVVLLLLSLGLAATLAAWISRFMPTFDTAADALDRITTFASAVSGGLTILYLFVTRLLGQLEADILAILTIDDSAKS